MCLKLLLTGLKVVLIVVYELIVFGGVAFWLLTAIVFLIALSMVESLEEFSGASALQCGYIVFLVLFCNIRLDLSPYWWSPIPYLLIGLVWFLFMMTHRVKSLRRWIDKQQIRTKSVQTLRMAGVTKSQVNGSTFTTQSLRGRSFSIAFYCGLSAWLSLRVATC